MQAVCSIKLDCKQAASTLHKVCDEDKGQYNAMCVMCPGATLLVCKLIYMHTLHNNKQP